MASESKAASFIGVGVAVGALAWSSLAFAVPGGLGNSLTASQPSHFLQRTLAAEDSFEHGSFAAPALCTGIAAAGMVAVVASGIRRVTARKIATGPTGEYFPRNTFCGGLVGCEFGGYGRHEYDPIGFGSRYPEHLPWYREAELKHGRISMLACLGLIVPDAFRIPLDTFESADLNLVNAHNKLIGPGLGDGPMWWLLIFCAAIESTRFKQLGLAFENLTLDNAGDLGFGKGFLPKSKDAIVAMQIKELKNGRLAMMGISGAMTQSVIWDSPHFPFIPN